MSTDWIRLLATLAVKYAQQSHVESHSAHQLCNRGEAQFPADIDPVRFHRSYGDLGRRNTCGRCDRTYGQTRGRALNSATIVMNGIPTNHYHYHNPETGRLRWSKKCLQVSEIRL